MKKDFTNCGLSRAAMLLLVMLLTAVTAWADDVTYIDADGQEQTVNATLVTSATTAMGSAGETWYYVNDDVVIDDRVELAGTVNLILTDGCDLVVNKGMHLPAGSTLNIYTQSTGSGYLKAYCNPYDATIGGNRGDEDHAGEDGGIVNVYGGRIYCGGPLGGGLGKTNGTATIKLSWTNAEDYVYVNGYNGTVTLDKAFTDYNSNNYAAGSVSDNSDINNKTILSFTAVTYYNENVPTCTENGYAQDCWYKYATQTYYADDACTQPLDKADVMIPALGHDMTHHDAQSATFTENGNVEYWYCDRCKTYFFDEKGEYVWDDFDLSDVTYGVEGNATDGYSIRMPKHGTATLTIDEGITSFKIYDDGGADANYSDNCSGNLVLIAPSGKQVVLTGTITSQAGCDMLNAYRGITADDDNRILSWKGSDEDGKATSIGMLNGTSMLLNFYSDYEKNYAGLDLTASIQPEGNLSIPYVDAKGTEQTVDNATLVTSATTAMGSAGQTTWYYANGYIVISDRVELKGTVNLILAGGCDMYVNKGMHLPAGNTLNIFTQSTGNGYLEASYYDNGAAIGGNNGDDDHAGEDGGSVNVYGGRFYCSGPLGGGWGKTNGTATIALSWTHTDDIAYVDTYNGTVTLLKAFTEEDGTNHAAGPVSDNADINNKNLRSTELVVFYAQREATCTDDGYAQNCWFKPATQTYYADEACTEVLENVKTPAFGHKMDHEGTPAAITTSGKTDGSVEYWHCSRCDTYFFDEKGEREWYNFNPSDVAFCVEGNASDGYSVRMPKKGTATLTIGDGVTSFKIYDDGGADANYSDNCNGNLVLTAPAGQQVVLTGTITSQAGCDVLSAYRGKTADDENRILSWKGSDEDGKATSIGMLNGTSMLLNFYSNYEKNYAGLDLTASIQPEGLLSVPYVDADGQEQTVDAKEVTSKTTAMGTEGEKTWYYANGYIDIDDRVELKGTVNLILTEGCHLGLDKGLHLPTGNKLNVFTQSTGSGSLEAWGDDNGAAIGGNGGDEDQAGEDGGNVNVYGGRFYCYGPLGGGRGDTNGTATIALSWTHTDDIVYAGTYNGTVTLLKAFAEEDGTNHAAGPVSNNADINSKNLRSTELVVFYAQREATCTDDGYAQNCWFKPATQTYYADEACTEVLENVKTPAFGHKMDHEGTPATITTSDKTDGSVEYWHCSRCDTYFFDEKGETEWYNFNSSDVAFCVEGNAPDGYSVRMPKKGTATLTIGDGVTSFKIYDDGGADANYSDNCDGNLVLIAPSGQQVVLTGTITSEADCDELKVYRGTTADGDNRILDWKSSDEDGKATSIGMLNGTSMLLRFYSDDENNYAGLDLTASIQPEGELSVPYVDADGQEQMADAKEVTSTTTAMGAEGKTTWYYANGYIDIDDRVELKGTVNLILAGDCDMYVNEGMHLPAGNTLNVFAQSTGSGYLEASYYDNGASIGGNDGDDDHAGEDGGSVNVYGGMIESYGPLGGGDGKTHGTATIALSWTHAEDYVYADTYNGSVTLLKAFTDRNSNNYAAGSVSDNADINEKNLLSFNAVTRRYQEEATCTDDGYAQDCWYKYATKKCYADKACTEELENVLIPALGHIMKQTKGIPATITESGTTDGTVEYWHCSRCDNYYCDVKGDGRLYDFDPSEVAFCVEGNDKDGYFVRMPKHGTATLTIDNSVSSFKIYDNGGTANNYSDDCDGRIVVAAPDGKQIQLTGTILSEVKWDYLNAYRGTVVDDDNMLLEIWSDKDEKKNPLLTDIEKTCATTMLIRFTSDESVNYAGLDLTATIIPIPDIVLTDDADNSKTLEENHRMVCNVTLKGRTLWKDGDWNTLCLPFDVTIADSPLDGTGVQAMVLNEKKSNLTDGTLTLTFDDATKIYAGTPFLIKWDGDGTNNLVEPEFTAVTIFNEFCPAEFDGGVFKGTYQPVAFTKGDKTKLYLGFEDKLYWPDANFNLNAFRAYFDLSDHGDDVEAVRLNFGDGSETTSLREMRNEESRMRNGDYYTLDGRKLTGRPTQKGIYIVNGRKTVIK